MSKLNQIYTNYLVPFLYQRYSSSFDSHKLTFIYDLSHINSFDDYKKVYLYVTSQQIFYLVTFHVFEIFIEPSSINVIIAPDTIKNDLIEADYSITDYSTLNYYVYHNNYIFYLSWYMFSNKSPFLVLNCRYTDSSNKKHYVYTADGDYQNFLKNLNIRNKSLFDLINIHYDNYYNYLSAHTGLNKFVGSYDI